MYSNTLHFITLCEQLKNYVQQYITFYSTMGVAQKLCTAVHYILLHYVALHYNILHYITLHCTADYTLYTSPHYIHCSIVPTSTMQYSIMQWVTVKHSDQVKKEIQCRLEGDHEYNQSVYHLQMHIALCVCIIKPFTIYRRTLLCACVDCCSGVFRLFHVVYCF